MGLFLVLVLVLVAVLARVLLFLWLLLQFYKGVISNNTVHIYLEAP